MSRKYTLAAGVALVLAGVVAIVLINRNPGAPKANSQSSNRPAAAPADTQAQDDGAAERAISRNRARNPVKHPELAAKYGESRTNLSKRVSTNVIGLLEDAMEIGETAMSGIANGPFGSEGGLRMALGGLGNDLKLSADQQAKAVAIYAEYQKRERARSKAALERLKQDPSALMQLMLASDALSRGESTEEEYKQLQATSGQDLKGVLNPLDQQNFRGGKPLQDPAFVSEFKAVLDPTQSETLQTAVVAASTKTDPAQAEEGNISNLPTMELEKLDQTVESAKKFTTGIKSIMEGMGGLQDLGPMMEQQRQRNSGQQAPATDP
ncbi:MAG: hypothetical protein NTW21_18945 [Verrucomicrobia bacterium]|nr:hypothetical protein [Verrucomicrobiota bacterium]